MYKQSIAQQIREFRFDATRTFLPDKYSNIDRHFYTKTYADAFARGLYIARSDIEPTVYHVKEIELYIFKITIETCENNERKTIATYYLHFIEKDDRQTNST